MQADIVLAPEDDDLRLPMTSHFYNRQQMTDLYHNNYSHSEILLMQIINICKHEHKRTDYYITAA